MTGRAIVQRTIAAIAAFSVIACVAARAETYPTRPIHFIVPFAPGGGVDIVARMVAQRMSETLGQPVVIENRVGGGGILGADYVAKSAPDGYTFLVTTSGQTILPSLTKVPWDAVKDFVPVSMVVSYQLMLVVNPSVPAKTLEQLIALAKANPGTLNYGTGGIGTPPHLAMELLKHMAGIKIQHVPYRGNGLVTLAVQKNEVQMMLDTMVGPLADVRAGKLRALAVTGKSRSPLVPDIPTINEAGVPGYSFEGWTGMFAPQGTPDDIIKTVNAALVKALAVSEISKRLVDLGYQPVGDTPEEFAEIVKSDLVKMAKIIKDADIHAN
jgi:tripartite-type tricarboxylate transporter receptor subunit TctC